MPVRPEAEAKRDESLRRSTEAPEYMSLWDRCISRGAPGWIIPAGYNNAYQIIQTQNFVVIHAEMIHDARIIPLNGGQPLPPHVRLIEGHSRGQWEGDTLVVETTNFSDRNWVATRREWLAFSAAVIGGREAFARPQDRRWGVQLYTVRSLLANDAAATLERVAAIGDKDLKGRITITRSSSGPMPAARDGWTS